MKIQKILAALLATTLWCSAHAADVPSAAAFPDTVQMKAVSLQHWKVIGEDMAKATAEALGDKAKAGVFVALPDNPSLFVKTVASFYTEALVSKNIRVVTKLEDDTVLIQMNSLMAIHRGAPETRHPLSSTLLATGVVVLRDIAWDSWRAGLIALGAASDVSHQLNKPAPQAEVAVTATAFAGTEILAHKSNVYYVDVADAALFAPVVTKTLKLEGDAQ